MFLGSRLELAVIEPRIKAVKRHQLIVAAPLDDMPLPHDQDDIGVFDGRQAVGNDD